MTTWEKNTHNVAKTSMTVRLTSMTMSRYCSVNRFTIWLKKMSIAVGRFTWHKNKSHLMSRGIKEMRSNLLFWSL